MKQLLQNRNVICGLYLVFYVFCANSMSNDEGSCQSYAGGTVYPQGTDKSDHKLQWTKAVSK